MVDGQVGVVFVVFGAWTVQYGTNLRVLIGTSCSQASGARRHSGMVSVKDNAL